MLMGLNAPRFSTCRTFILHTGLRSCRLWATQFDEDFGYEVFLKKAMTAKDVEERKRNEEEKKAKK